MHFKHYCKQLSKIYEENMTERRTPLSLYQYDGVQDLGYFDVLFCCLVLDKRDLSARVLTLCIQRYSRVLKYSSTGICNVPFCLKFTSFKTVQSQTIRLTIQPTKYSEALEPSSRSHYMCGSGEAIHNNTITSIQVEKKMNN